MRCLSSSWMKYSTDLENLSDTLAGCVTWNAGNEESATDCMLVNGKMSQMWMDQDGTQDVDELNKKFTDNVRGVAGSQRALTRMCG